MYNISPELLKAISWFESRHNPRAINYNKNGTYDIGHMQINSSWYHTLGHALWMSLGDPCQNTKVGAWILARCIAQHGYTWQAVGCYHSSRKHRQLQYANNIYNVLNKRYTSWKKQ